MVNNGENNCLDGLDEPSHRHYPCNWNQQACFRPGGNICIDKVNGEPISECPTPTNYNKDLNVPGVILDYISINGEEYVIEHEHPNYRKNHAYNTSLMEIDDQYMTKEYKHMHRFENEDGTQF